MNAQRSGMSFAMITSRLNNVGNVDWAAHNRECSRRLCRPLTAAQYSGPARQLLHRGLVFLGSSAILFVVGAVLTGLGYYAILSHVARALGPMCIALAMLMIIVAARYLTVAKRLSELAAVAEATEQAREDAEVSSDSPSDPSRTTVIAIVTERGHLSQNVHFLQESYGFSFQPGDFIPPPTYDSTIQGNLALPNNIDPQTRDSNDQANAVAVIPLSEQEPPPPYSEAIKTGPPPGDQEINNQGK